MVIDKKIPNYALCDVIQTWNGKFIYFLRKYLQVEATNFIPFKITVRKQI